MSADLKKVSGDSQILSDAKRPATGFDQAISAQLKRIGAEQNKCQSENIWFGPSPMIVIAPSVYSPSAYSPSGTPEPQPRRPFPYQIHKLHWDEPTYECITLYKASG